MLAGSTSIDQGRTLSDVFYTNLAVYSQCTVVAQFNDWIRNVYINCLSK